MPSINKLRVSNVLFDNNSRFYDDIIIPVNEGKLLIEAENGSGKTLLMQCILQSVRPLLYFRRKNAENKEQPTIKNLFRSNDNTTMHSMIEWSLDEGSTYDYMITGFCAKKIQKETEEGLEDDIEYFNYSIMYKKGYSFSVESIPLKTKKNDKIERMSYSQLEKKLREMSTKDDNLLVKIFRNKGEYETFLNTYNINSSEFELMRNINLKEGGSEEYFTEHYKTPYNFIVGEIVDRIESVNKMKLQTSYTSDTDLATSLYEIKSTMEELKHKQEKKNEIEIIETYLNKLMDVNERLIDELESKEKTFVEVAKGLNSQVAIINAIKKEKSAREEYKRVKEIDRNNIENESKENEEALSRLDEEIKTLNKEIERVKEFRDILKRRSEKETLLKEIEAHNEELNSIENSINSILETAKTIKDNILSVKNEEELRRNENIYVEYLDALDLVIANEKTLELSNKGLKEIMSEELKTQGYLLYALKKEIEAIQPEIDKIDKEIENNKDKHKELAKQREENLISISNISTTIEGNLKLIELNKNTIETKEKALLTQTQLLQNLKEEKKNYTNDINLKVANIKLKENNSDELFTAINNLDAICNECYETEGFKRSLINAYGTINTITNSIHEEVNNNSARIMELDNKDLNLELKMSTEPLHNEINNLENTNKEYQEEIDDLKRSIRDTNANISNTEDSLAEYEIAIEDISELFTKYSETERFTLKDKLDNNLNDVSKELFNVENSIAETSKTIEELEKNKGVSIPDGTKKCYEILSKAYASAMLGKNFNENLTTEEKEKYLSISNLIPISVILNNNDYNSLLKSKTLLEKINDYVAPIINIDRIKNGETCSNDIVYISSKDKDFYINEDKRKQQIETLKNTLSKLTEEKHIIKARLNDLKNDFESISRVNNLYSENFEQEQQRIIKEYELEIKEYQKEINSFDIKIDETNKQIKELNNKIEVLTNENKQKAEQLKKEKQELTSKNNLLNNSIFGLGSLNTLIHQLESNLTKEVSTRELLKTIENEVEEAKGTLERLTKDNLSLDNKKTILTEENTRIKLNIKTIDSKIDELSSAKTDHIIHIRSFEDDIKSGEFVAVDTIAVANDKSINDLKNELRMIRSKMNEQGSDIDILKKNIDANKKIAKDKKDSINTDIVSFEELESKKNTIVKNEKSVFEEIQDRLTVLIEEEELNTEKLSQLKDERTSCNTSIKLKTTNAERINTNDDVLIPENYNPELELDKFKGAVEKVEDFKKIETDKRRGIIKQLKDISNEISDLENGIHDLDTQLLKAQGVKSAIDRLMKENSIMEDETLGTFENGPFVLNIFESKIRKHNSNIDHVSQSHNMLRRECLDKLKDSAFDIVTILEEIKPKDNAVDVSKQNVLIEVDCLGILKQTKDNLETELDQLNKLKENFIDKCLERTENLLSKIKKVQKLVTIEYEGKKIPLIKINLNELNAEDKKIKMRTHIDSVLGQIDTKLEIEETNLQTERISKMLSASKLLEQVISNTKRCEVKIYVPKNESNVAANGSYVNWGGTASGGQRNVMYFTVTIALMLFIRELSSVSTVSKQTKVLYVDGAFKASASTYLWECICPLLVDNNIQFIVTNMGTPSALMKMFDSVALLKGFSKRIGDKTLVENRISQNSTFKADERTLKTDNILHSFEEYRIPKVETNKPKTEEYQEQNLLSLL